MLNWNCPSTYMYMSQTSEQCYSSLEFNSVPHLPMLRIRNSHFVVIHIIESFLWINIPPLTTEHCVSIQWFSLDIITRWQQIHIILHNYCSNRALSAPKSGWEVSQYYELYIHQCTYLEVRDYTEVKINWCVLVWYTVCCCKSTTVVNSRIL